MENRKPIIVIGAGRTGSTIYHHMFSQHPDLAWLPGAICQRFPNRPELLRLCMKAIDWPAAGDIVRNKLRPGECYPFWDHYYKGFSTPCRDLVGSDATNKVRKDIQETMSKLLTEKRNRWLIKITGWPRIGFLSEIFEDAKFIHVMRDGRAVANSLIDVYFWRGWRGPENWTWGQLSPDQKEEWYRYDQSFVALAAIQWKLLMDATEKAKSHVEEDRFLEVKYEHLCADPIKTFREAVEFAELEWSTEFERNLQKFRVRNNNDKFRRDLTTRQQKILEDILGDYLGRYGYS